MNDPRQYGTPGFDLRKELIDVSANLANLHKELGFLSGEQHRGYLTEYIKSPGGSVSAKNREAEYNTRDITVDVIGCRAQIAELTTNRDLIVFLLLSVKPTLTWIPAEFDGDGLLTTHG